MIRKFILLLSACACVATSNAQVCGTTEMTQGLMQQYPDLAKQIDYYTERLEKHTSEFTTAERISPRIAPNARTTADGSAPLILIPVVMHVIHDNGNENVEDNDLYELLENINNYFQAKNTAANGYTSSNNNLESVIAPFKPYIGNMNYYFFLANRDPQGKPTKGITRRLSYLTNGGDNQAKFDLWPPSSYLNIWVEKKIGLGADAGVNGIVAAYAMLPAAGAAIPYYDGLMTGYSYIGSTDATIPHEIGHYFNLSHTFGTTNSPGTGNTCTGDDDVDDTPPTRGILGGCPLYDTGCATGYFKIYPSQKYPGFDSLANYPDTVNTQNIMNYADCKSMFTKGQVVRATAAAMSEVAGRNNLYSVKNLKATGLITKDSADDAKIRLVDVLPPTDLPVIPEYSTNVRFACTNTQVTFTNRSWNDTVSTITWTFPDGADTKTSTSKNNVTNKFKQSGWVPVTIKVKGNNTDEVTLVDDKTLYIADEVGTRADGYGGEFNRWETEKWPMFNYYNNNFKWEFCDTVGYSDNTSVMYRGADSRVYPQTLTGVPRGDYDDMFSPPFDMTAYGTGVCRLNYLYSGATRTATSIDMNDTLEITYNTDCGTANSSWKKLAVLTKADIANVGTVGEAFRPHSQADWALQSIDVPQAARTNHTIFRFRYKPGVNQKGNTVATMAQAYSTGNNFYMDRFNVSAFPLGVNTLLNENQSVAVAPNPTNGDAFVVLKGVTGSTAQVNVMDISGRVVFRTEQKLTNAIDRIDIPQSAIATKGIYMVQILNDNQAHTEKLVVY